MKCFLVLSWRSYVMIQNCAEKKYLYVYVLNWAMWLCLWSLQTPNSCNFFNWADKKEISEIATTAAEVAQSSFTSNLLHEESRRKIMKLKKKLGAERRKSNWLVVAIVVSWAVTFFAVMYCISVRGSVVRGLILCCHWHTLCNVFVETDEWMKLMNIFTEWMDAKQASLQILLNLLMYL